MPKSVAVFDIDEVLADVRTPLNLFLKEKHGIVMQRNDWRVFKSELNPKTRRVAPDIMKFIHSEDFFAGLKPFPGVVAGLRRVATENRIFIATARLPKFKGVTEHWLAKLNTPFEDIFCGEIKYGVIVRVRADKFVDDMLNEHQGLLPYRRQNPNFKQIINTRPWNDFYNDPRFIRAHDWVRKSGQKTILERIIQKRGCRETNH